jgi:hypothetical protein
MDVYNLLKQYVEDPSSVTETQLENAMNHMFTLIPTRKNQRLIASLMSIKAGSAGNVPTLLHFYETES